MLHSENACLAPLCRVPPTPGQALHYLLLISEVEEVEIFKICLEYWNALASDLYREIPYGLGTAAPLYVGSGPCTPGGRAASSPQSARRLLYGPVLTKVGRS